MKLSTVGKVGFLAVLAFGPPVVRRWMILTWIVTVGAFFSLGHVPTDYATTHTTGAWGQVNNWVEADYIASKKAFEDSLFGMGYTFPWYCKLLIVAAIYLWTVGLIRTWRTVCRQADARHAAGQQPLQRLRRFTNGRALIAYDGNPQPPQSPPGPSPAPTAPVPPTPPPAAPAPMGSTTPTLWIPTYSGPSKPLQRREISLSGVAIADHRGVDPDAL